MSPRGLGTFWDPLFKHVAQKCEGFLKISGPPHFNLKNKAVEDNKGNEREELYSQRVRAGKRTYFFDVRTTRGGDYYVTITESKKVFNDDGFYYQKHKIFLYKEDFNKFQDAVNGTLNHVKEELLPDVDFSEFDREYEDRSDSEE